MKALAILKRSKTNHARESTHDYATVKVQRLVPHAEIPAVSQPGDVAADIKAAYDVVIPARGRALVKTGLVVEIPVGFRIRFQSRSGLSLKSGIEVGAGLIDNSYRNELGVVLHNHTDTPYQVKAGDRVANLCLERYTHPVFEEVLVVPPTGRSSGFGSSGR